MYVGIADSKKTVPGSRVADHVEEHARGLQPPTGHGSTVRARVDVSDEYLPSGLDAAGAT
jgi:hypothetical protein